MKKLTPLSLLASSALLVLLSCTNASAGMKCEEGKCGSSMKEAATKSDEDKKESIKEMKCGDGKCGSMKTTASSDTNTTQAK